MEEKELDKVVRLEEARKLILQDQLTSQMSNVESLKEALGVITKLTEAESTQLRISREITKAINSQDITLNSVAEKNKQIAKNKALIAKSSLSDSILDIKRIAKANQYSEAITLQQKILQDKQEAQLKSGKLDEKEINAQQAKVDLEQTRLNKVLGSLRPMEQAAYFEYLSVKNLKAANAERELELETLEKIEDAMGLTGDIAKELSKIPGLGGLEASAEKVRKELKAAADAGKPILDKAQTMRKIGAQFKEDAIKGLTDPVALVGAGIATATGLFKTFQDVFKTLDKLTSGTARNFGISNEQAGKLNHNLKAAGLATGDAFHSLVNMNEAFVTLNNRYGVFAEFSDQAKTDFVDLTKKAGITAEAAGALTDTTFLTRKGLKETTVEYSGQIKMLKQTTGLAINERQVLEAVKDVSAAIKLQLGGSAEAIATAVFKAKALGLEMKDLAAISSTLLNFQSSIEDELAAELLTGKQLNLEGARYAALIGDQATLADELAKNFGNAAEFQKMNVIQQEALAKAVGLTKDSLAESLMKREAMAALSAFEGENEKERYDSAVKRLGVEGARVELGNDALAAQMESVSLADRFEVAMNGVKEAFLPLAEKAIPAFATVLKFAGEHMGLMLTAAIAYKAVVLGIAAAQIAASFAMNPLKAGIGMALGVAAIGGMMAYSAVGDVAMEGNGGPIITSPEPGGLNLGLHGADDVMAGPGLISDYNTLKKSRNAGSTPTINVDTKITPSDTKVTINLSGQAIGNAFARQKYKVGSTVKALGGGVDYSATV